GGSVIEAAQWVLNPPGLPPGGSVQFLYCWKFNLTKNLISAWRGLVHSFIASPAAPHEWISIMENGAVLIVGAFLAADSLRYFKGKKLIGSTTASLWVWVLVMNGFLFFYLPGALRFRLLFMPPLIY